MAAKKKPAPKKTSKKKPAPKKKGKRGRPSLLVDPMFRAKIIEMLELGMTNSKVIEYCGCGKATFYDWMSGKLPKDIPEGFSDTLKKARLSGELQLLKAVKSGARGWQGSAWILERTRSGTYGRTVEISHTIPPEVLEKLNDEQLGEIIRTGAVDNVLKLVKEK